MEFHAEAFTHKIANIVEPLLLQSYKVKLITIKLFKLVNFFLNLHI